MDFILSEVEFLNCFDFVFTRNSFDESDEVLFFDRFLGVGRFSSTATSRSCGRLMGGICEW